MATASVPNKAGSSRARPIMIAHKANNGSMPRATNGLQSNASPMPMPLRTILTGRRSLSPPANKFTANITNSNCQKSSEISRVRRKNSYVSANTIPLTSASDLEPIFLAVRVLRITTPNAARMLGNRAAIRFRPSNFRESPCIQRASGGLLK